MFRRQLFLRSALSKKFGDIEVHKIGVVKNDRFDRALYFVALMTVRGDDMQHFAGNPVLVSERNAAEGVTHIVECGPGSVLTGLAKRTVPELPVHSTNDDDALAAALAAIKGN